MKPAPGRRCTCRAVAWGPPASSSFHGCKHRMGPPLTLPQLETRDQFQQFKGLKMGNPRTPMARAIATGRVLHDAKRFSTRNEPASTGPLGPAPAWMTAKAQRDSWEMFRTEIPWLTKSHRALTAIACIARADLRSGGEFNVRMATLLRQCLGSMGATPASKIAMASEGSKPDPADMYFA